MKTFLVRAQKEKKKKKKILSRLGLGNEEMGFVKIQVKRAKLKRNGKSLFPRSTSPPLCTRQPSAGNVHRRALPYSE